MSDEERSELERLVRGHTTGQQLGLRAQIVLAAAEGLNNRHVARTLGVAAKTARQWRQRWRALREVSLEDVGVAERLADGPRPGAPARSSAEQVCQIIALACELPAASGRPISQWSARELVDEITRRGIVATISARRYAGRVLKSGRPAGSGRAGAEPPGPGHLGARGGLDRGPGTAAAGRLRCPRVFQQPAEHYHLAGPLSPSRRDVYNGQSVSHPSDREADMTTRKVLLGVGLAVIVLIVLGVVLTPRWLFGPCGALGSLSSQPVAAGPGGGIKIGPAVARLIQAQQQGTLVQAAGAMAVQLEGERLAVAITADPCRVAAASAAVTAAGGSVIATQDNVLYGFVPVGALTPLSQRSDVLYVDLTSRQGPLQT